MLGGLVDAGLQERQETVVTGVVHNAIDTRPDEFSPPRNNVTVEIKNGAVRTVTTDSQGRYVVTRGRDVTCTLTVEQSNYIPFQQTLKTEGATATLDFPLDRTATVPATSTPTTTTQVEAISGYWRIPVRIGAQTRPPSATGESILRRPDGVVIQLGASGTDASHWSRTGTCASDRSGDQVGDHIVYDRLGTFWHRRTVTFGTMCQPPRVNGQAWAGYS